MEPHQVRILARISESIQGWRAGDVGTRDLLNDIWGLISAAELQAGGPRTELEALYYRLSAADDARQPFMPPGIGTDQDVEDAMDELDRWAKSLAG